MISNYHNIIINIVEVYKSSKYNNNNNINVQYISNNFKNCNKKENIIAIAKIISILIYNIEYNQS